MGKKGKGVEYKQVVVFITVDSQKTAQKIADVLLTERKAACVNIVPALESHYWWQGKKESTQELLLIVKTQAKLLSKLIAIVKKHHPYSVPEIIALPVVGGNEDYLEWINRETK
jgi:periplasmic divalent cation tolerance protein